MARVGSAARIKFQGIDTQGVDEFSPLEDKCVLVYRAARRYAEVNGFAPYVHRGVPGVRGKMVMSHLVRDLFPNMSKDDAEITNGLINQVLRKTDAAVCVKRPKDRGDVAEWFVADRMPENIVIVALSHARKGPGEAVPRSFDEKHFMTRNEMKLRPEEVEREPGEVVVTKTQDEAPVARTPDVLQDLHEERRRWRAEMKQRVLEEVCTNPVPLSVHDVTFYLNEAGYEISDSTVRGLLNELTDEGKLVSRIETEQEKVVRGGGRPPAARRKALWSEAPGPVPVRTRLPDRVPPATPMAQHREDRVMDKNRTREVIMEAIRHKETQTTGKIAEATGYSREHVRNLLKELMDEGLVYSDRGAFRLARRRRTVVEPQTEVVPVSTPETSQTPEKSTNSTSVDIANPLVGRIVSLVQELAATGDASLEVESLQKENDQLREENERLKRAVAGLNQALAALQE